MPQRNQRPQASYQRGYYDRAGGDRNERRRAQYAADATKRAENQKRSRAWRQSRAAGTPVERVLYREVNGRNVRVYSLGQIADLTDYAVSTLRLLITNGDLPAPTLPGKHRYYTGPEVTQIKNLLRKRR